MAVCRASETNVTSQQEFVTDAAQRPTILAMLTT
jgi:hypothetical protein